MRKENANIRTCVKRGEVVLTATRSIVLQRMMKLYLVTILASSVHSVSRGTRIKGVKAKCNENHISKERNVIEIPRVAARGEKEI